jgi:predicted small secreted protein
MMRRLCHGLVALLLGVSLAGCNTIAGMGKDMERAGESIQGAAKK